MAGYSGTPLPQKLGIKPGHRLALVGAPRGFSAVLGQLPQGARQVSDRSTFDVAVVFTTSQGELATLLPKAKKRLNPNGGLWIAWPKKSSGMRTDLTENHIREAAIAAGLVDNKVCAVDDTWSGLRPCPDA
jgi:hypothetical protein